MPTGIKTQEKPGTIRRQSGENICTKAGRVRRAFPIVLFFVLFVFNEGEMPASG